MNTKGWTSNKHGLQWLHRCFEPATREKAGGKMHLLLCDSHESHVTPEFIIHCMFHNIVLLILPPHTSHLTQPLDIGIFSPLKRHMAEELHGIIMTEVACLQKVEWVSAYARARKRLCVKLISSVLTSEPVCFPFVQTKSLAVFLSSAMSSLKHLTLEAIKLQNQPLLLSNILCLEVHLQT